MFSRPISYLYDVLTEESDSPHDPGAHALECLYFLEEEACAYGPLFPNDHRHYFRHSPRIDRPFRQVSNQSFSVVHME